MDWLQTVFLALLQGLTEFLPISSSAHLILPSQLLGWHDQGLAFDVAVHVGTLMAVLTYFRVDLRVMSRAWCCSVIHRQHSQQSRLAWAVLLGTIPVGLAGLLLAGFIENYLRSTLVIALATLLFALVLWLSQRLSDSRVQHQRGLEKLQFRDVLYIGLAQVIALIPGTSRSGITIAMALMLGLTRTAAARFSFLLSIPVILLAGSLKILQLTQSLEAVLWGQLLLGTVVAFIAAYACIGWFLTILEKVGLLPFVLYRLFLGTLLLVFFI